MEKVDKFLSVLGIEITNSDEKEYHASCVFCGSSKFRMVIKTGQWGCRRCQMTGNAYTLIREIYNNSDYTNEVPPYLESKGVLLNTCTAWGVFVWGGRYWMPTFNQLGEVTNLYRFAKQGDKTRLYGLPGMPPGLFMDDTFLENDPIYVMEGPTDGMLAYQTCPEEASICAVPGANIFLDSWANWMDEAYFVYDNDHERELTTGKVFFPGWEGMCKAVEKTGGLIMRWGSSECDYDLPDGYDFGDLLEDDGPEAAWDYVEKHLGPPPTTSITHKAQIACHDIGRLVDEFSKHLYMPDSYRYTLYTMIATIVSVKLKAEPLFLRVVGPPASGKTTFAEALATSKDHVVSRSILTGLHSGIGSGENDASLIKTIDGRCLIIKDADTLMSHPNVKQILAEIRDVFDGVSRSQYRTGEIKEYEGINTAFILCGTQKVRTLDKTSLGERFLNAEILEPTQNRKPFVDFAFQNTLDKIADKEEFKDATTLKLGLMSKGFLNYLTNKEKVMPKFSPRQQKMIKAYAVASAYMRAQIDEEDDTASPHPETPNRLVGQYTKLAVVLSWMMPLSETIPVLHHVFKSTAYGHKYDIVKTLYKSSRPLSATQLSLRIKASRPTITKYCQILRTFQILTMVEGTGKSHYYTLTKSFQRVWDSLYDPEKV